MSRCERSALRDYLDQIGPEPPLSGRDERDLAARVAAGDVEARDRLVRHNLRLVVCLARAHAGRGVEVEDLVAEGNLGLIRAVEGYDGRDGVRFATYAAYWIDQSMRRAVINHGRDIRLPAHTVRLMAKWRRASEELSDRLGREATAEEIGAALGLTGKKLATARKVLRARGLSRLGGEDGASALEQTADDDPAADAPGHLSEREELALALGRLAGLGPRQAAVVRMRFGLDGGERLTLRQVGQHLGVSREGARKMERAALEMLAGGTRRN